MLATSRWENMRHRTETEFHCARGRGYLATLVSHFSRKIQVDETDDTARLQFSCGLAELCVIEGGLQLRIEAATPEQMTQTCEVVESHLLRFAFREDPPPLVWRVLS
jgi:hypothetical protein